MNTMKRHHHPPKIDGARLLSRGRELVVDATTSHEPLPVAGRIHAGCVFPKVPRAAALEPRRPTLPAHTAVYEVIENRTAMSLFGEHMRKLAFRRLAQVESFCIKHKEWLRGEFATLFPLRAGDYWYFVDAYILDNGTVELNDADLDFPPMWAATNRPRVVVQVN